MLYKILLLITVFYLQGTAVTSLGTSMVSKGVWSVLNVQRCKNHEEYSSYEFEVTRKKLNRSCDGFDSWIKLPNAVDDTFATRVDICKFVDGGCKPYQVLADDCFCCFIKKYAEENVKNILTLMGVDPPDCPVPAGEYKMEGYVFDYSELPDDGIVGKFIADAYLLEEQVEVACISLTVEFKEKEEEDDE